MSDKIVVNLFAPDGKNGILEVFRNEGFKAYVVPAEDAEKKLVELGFVKSGNGYGFEAPASAESGLFSWVVKYPIAYSAEMMLS